MAASAPHVETLVLPHLPSSPIHVALFKQVENAPFLRQQLLDGNPLFEYAFLDATSVRLPSLPLVRPSCRLSGPLPDAVSHSSRDTPSTKCGPWYGSIQVQVGMDFVAGRTTVCSR